MKAYLITTGTLFGVLAALHVWDTVTSWSRIAGDPSFLVMPSLGLVAAGLSVWAFRLLGSAARS
jgi:hypothetical protein